VSNTRRSFKIILFKFQARWTELWSRHWQEVYEEQLKIFAETKRSTNKKKSEAEKVAEEVMRQLADLVVSGIENPEGGKSGPELCDEMGSMNIGPSGRDILDPEKSGIDRNQGPRL